MRTNRILYAFSALLLFLTTWLLWPAQLDTGIARETSEGSNSVVELPDYHMKTFRYASMKGGRRELEVFSDNAVFFLDRQEAHGKVITAYFFNIAGESTTLNGDEGIFQMDKQHLRVLGNVKSLSPDGFLLEGSVADYFVAKRLLEAPEPVQGVTAEKDVRIWANRAESFIDTYTVQFWGDVRIEYDTKRQGMMKVRADRAQLDRAQKLATYYDKVKMNQQKMEMTSSEAGLFYGAERARERSEHAAERSEQAPGGGVTLGGTQEGAGVKYLVSKKDVTIRETLSRYSQSQQAEFFSDTNSIVLTGFPSVIEGRDTITGDKLTLYRSTGVVEVTAANAAFADSPQDRKKNVSRDKLSGDDLELLVEDKPKK